jgi:hypothetical protein
MNADATGLEVRNAVREAVAQTRRRPAKRGVITASSDSDGDFGSIPNAIAIELVVEATTADGELAGWLDDVWWTAAFHDLADRTVTLHVSPTPGALLHPVVLSHLEMVRRVMPEWRIVGHACFKGSSGNDVANQVAVSPYHEVRSVDRSQVDVIASGGTADTDTLVDIFGRIRREQERLGVSSPILVRMPDGTGVPSG